MGYMWQKHDLFVAEMGLIIIIVIDIIVVIIILFNEKMV